MSWVASGRCQNNEEPQFPGPSESDVVARLTYRGISIVTPNGAVIDNLVERTDDCGVGSRLLAALNGSNRDSLRKLLASVYLTGVKEGVDRTLASGLHAESAPSSESYVPEDDELEPAALQDLRVEISRGVRTPIQAVVDRYRSSELKLPHLPETAVQLNGILSDPDYELETVVGVIRRDVNLTASVLNVAGSSFFSRSGRTPKSLNDAIARMGAIELNRFLLAWCNRRLFEFRSVDRAAELRAIWEHSLATATLAELLAGEIDDVNPTSYFLHGLLHDIGRPLLVQIFDDIEQDSPGQPTFGADEIARTIDTLHGQFGAALLQKWKFEESFCEVAQFHHQPQKSFSHLKLVSAVALSSFTVTEMGYECGESLESRPNPNLNAAAEILGVNRETIDFLSRQLKQKLSSVSTIA